MTLRVGPFAVPKAMCSKKNRCLAVFKLWNQVNLLLFLKQLSETGRGLAALFV